MAKRKADKILDDYLRGGSGLSKLYGREALAGPPAALDRTILDAARKAAPRAGGFNPFTGRWYVPLSAAAVIAIAIGLTVFMQHEGIPPVAPAANDRSRQSEPEAMQPRESQSTTAETDARRLERANQLARKSKPDVVAKSAAPAAMPAPKSVEEKIAQADKPPAPASGLAAVGAAREAKKESDMDRIAADVTTVRASGRAGAYQFSVTVRSPDKGCTQYADWWEVLSEDGRLLYRRVLLHSHVDEQPFTRGGGPVPVDANTVVVVRAHMNTTGYGGAALKGSVERGFAPVTLAAGFAADIASKPPLPDGCMF